MMLNNISVPMLGLAVIILALTTGRLRDRIEALEAARRPRLAAASQGAAVYDPRAPRPWNPEWDAAWEKWLSACGPNPDREKERIAFTVHMEEFQAISPQGYRRSVQARNGGSPRGNGDNPEVPAPPSAGPQ